MECKDVRNIRFRDTYFIKVEPYWNVKYYATSHIAIHYNIKVEPYWNVKIRTLENWESGKSIKVEPYWNVKSKSTLGYTITFQLK